MLCDCKPSVVQRLEKNNGDSEELLKKEFKPVRGISRSLSYWVLISFEEFVKVETGE